MSVGNALKVARCSKTHLQRACTFDLQTFPLYGANTMVIATNSSQIFLSSDCHIAFQTNIDPSGANLFADVMGEIILIVIKPFEFCFGCRSFNGHLSLIIASTLLHGSVWSFITKQVAMNRDLDDIDFIPVFVRF